MPPRAKPQRQRAKHFFREWRETKFPRQEDAEVALGWSQSKVSRLESGQTPYDQDDLEIAAGVYGCSPADLISRPPSQKATTPEMQLRSAMLAYGVDSAELDQVIHIIRTFVRDELAEEIPSPEQSPSATHPHEQARSKRQPQRTDV